MINVKRPETIFSGFLQSGKARLFFISLFFLGKLLYSQACNETIFGVIYDLHDNLPIEGAKITLLELNREQLSSNEGKFSFPQVCNGKYTLLLEHPSCTPITVKVNSPLSSEKRFYLEHHLTELDEIILSEKKQNKTSKTGVESSLSKDDIKRFQAQSLGDALTQLAGVSNIKTGNAIVKPVVHGVSGSRLAIVNHGIRIQDQEWGADHAPSIDINGADQIQLIKGATTLKFGGDLLGGVLQLVPAKYPLKDSLFGSSSMGYTHQGQGGYLLSNLTKTHQSGLFLGATVSLKNAGDLKNPKYNLSNTGNREQHAKIYFGRNTIIREWRVNYSYFQKEAGILSAAHLGTKGDLGRALKSETPLVINPWTRELKSPRQLNIHHSLNFKYHRRTSKGFFWEMSYNFQHNNRKEFDLRRGEAKLLPALDLRLMTHDIVVNLQIKQNDTFRWNTGISAQAQDNFSNPATGVRRLIPDYLRYKLGGYFTGEYVPSNNFNAEIGLRYDFDHIDSYKYYRIKDWDNRNYNQTFSSTIISTSNLGQHLTQQIKQYGNISLSAGIKQLFWENTYFLANIGYITRSPNPAELFSDGLHHANARYESGDLRLVQERAIKSLVSLEKQIGQFTYGLTGYWSRVKNYIFLQPSGVRQERSIMVVQADYQQVPRANLRGIDLDLKYTFNNKFIYIGKGSWVRASTSEGVSIVDIPPLNITNEIVFNPQKRPFVGLRLKSEFVGRQDYFPDFNFEENYFINGEIITEEVDVSTPPSSYHLMHFEVTTRLNKRWEIRASIENIFNIDYRNYLNRLRYFAGETGRNLRLELSYLF